MVTMFRGRSPVFTALEDCAFDTSFVAFSRRLRPTSLLMLSLLRFVDSTFPGNSYGHENSIPYK